MLLVSVVSTDGHATVVRVLQSIFLDRVTVDILAYRRPRRLEGSVHVAVDAQVLGRVCGSHVDDEGRLVVSVTLIAFVLLSCFRTIAFQFSSFDAVR